MKIIKYNETVKTLLMSMELPKKACSSICFVLISIPKCFFFIKHFLLDNSKICLYHE